MAGAALFSLQDEIYASRREGGADAIGFVADDGEHIARGNDLRGGGDDMRQQGLASDLMQHFRQLRFKARAFSGGHDGDGNPRRGSCGSGGWDDVRGSLHFSNYTLGMGAGKRDLSGSL